MISRRTILCSFLIVTTGFAQDRLSSSFRADVVQADLRRAADWQLAHPSGVEINDWVIAPLYDGLTHTAFTLGEPAYLATVLDLGQQAGWMPRWRTYFADDYAVSRAWIELYRLDPSHPERLAPSRAALDTVVRHPVQDALRFTDIPRVPRDRVVSRWTWADALFMGPPAFVSLYQATGDTKYLEFMDREYRFCYEQLYDSEAHLFYRDNRYIPQKAPNGERIFWSRGNGWVYAGLTFILANLPADHVTRSFYENLYREMTAAVLATQQPDGLWRPSLHDPSHIDVGEASGSAFFVYGLAWGINHGLLQRADHEPAVKRGWAALRSCLLPDGTVGYVQPIGGSPEQLSRESTQVYGTGAFLLAGSELLRLLGATTTLGPSAVLARAEAIVAERNAHPRAYARLVPERKDDLAWENDKVAFRIYGPALRDSVEDSGIDIWCKRVARPVLDRWYRLEHEQRISYHVDHGEGYDGYKVGDSRGCGGTALWIDGRPVTADTYIGADILWTGSDELAFRAVYRYPVNHDGMPVFEQRIIRLRLGERLCDVTVRYTRKPDDARGIEDFDVPVAIGLFSQSPAAVFGTDPEHGIARIDDQLDGVALFTGCVIDPAAITAFEQRPHPGEPVGHSHLWVMARADTRGEVHYRTGFAWAADGDITTPAQWADYLRTACQ